MEIQYHLWDTKDFTKNYTQCTKNEVSIKDFFSKCDQIRRKLQIWSHLLKKSLMKNFIFCEVTSIFNEMSKHEDYRFRITVSVWLGKDYCLTRLNILRFYKPKPYKWLQKAFRWCICGSCACVCVFISFHRWGFSWLKQNSKCNARDQASDVVLRKSLADRIIIPL